MNLNKIKMQINRDEIINFYISKYLIFNHDNLMKNFSKFLEDPTKNFDSYDSCDFYEYIYKNTTKQDIEQMKNKLNKFINSKEYILTEY